MEIRIMQIVTSGGITTLMTRC